MIKKQSVWALTLFSLILVLSVYYITLPNEIEVVNNDENVTATIEEEDNSYISTLKITNEEEKNKKTKELQEILTKEESTKEEKNNAYEELKLLNIIKSKEEELSMKINDEFKLDSFVQINGDQVKVVVAKKEHSTELASKIMDFIQKEFEDKMYISVKFEFDKEQ